MIDQFSRTRMLLGDDGMTRLFNARIAVFGIGGVGGYAVEALARSGAGGLDLFDDDVICLTNLNRQIFATRNNIGEYKVDVARRRIAEINPEATVTTHKVFYVPDTSGRIDLSVYDYIIDAIDTVSGKIELVVRADAAGVPLISSMGAGNRMVATGFEVADIYETSVCPLARVMRHELRKRGIQRLKVVYSKDDLAPIQWVPAERETDRAVESGYPRDTTQERQQVSGSNASIPVGAAGESTKAWQDPANNASVPVSAARDSNWRRQVPGSNAWVPAVVGMILAGEVINTLSGFAWQ